MTVPFHIHRKLGEFLFRLLSPADADVIQYDATSRTFKNETLAGAGIAPSGADYLVGTSQAGLSAEIVAGTTPGGELGGTWGTPTVDTTHSGSSHAATQAAAEATAAAALTTHEGAADPHTGYRLESADHTHESTGAQGGTLAVAALGDRSDTIWIPQQAFTLDGATRATIGASPDIVEGIQLDDGVTEGCYTTIVLPQNLTANQQPGYRAYFAPVAGGGGNARFTTTVAAVSSSAQVDQAGTAASTNTAVDATAEDLDFTASMTPAVNVGPGTFVRIHVQREGADAADTYAAALLFLGMYIIYTSDH